MGLFIEGGEEFCEFAFEVWGEDAFADGVVDFLHSPEPAELDSIIEALEKENGSR